MAKKEISVREALEVIFFIFSNFLGGKIFGRCYC